MEKMNEIKDAPYKDPSEPIKMDHVHTGHMRSLDKPFEYGKYDMLRMVPLVIGSALQSMPTWTDEASVEAAARLGRLLGFESKAGQNWREHMLPQVEEALAEAPEGFRREFLMNLFRGMMDIYWHGVRAIPNPVDKPHIVSNALGTALALRRMPEDMRKAYLDHLASVNALPEFLEREG